MEFLNLTKKKKRKTRKCLDEIRKRSRRTTLGDYSRSRETTQREKVNKSEGQPPRLVTNNRLTLNMFPKAIRSKTIRRPLLEEIKQKSSHTLQRSDKNIKCTSKDFEVECLEHCNSAASNTNMSMFNLEKDLLQEHESNHKDTTTKNQTKLNSTTNSQTSPESMIKQYSTSTTSLSSQTLDRDHGLELYEELMNKISSHLNNLTSAVNKENCIKTTKVNLQKLYCKSWGKEYNNSMLENEESNKSTLHSPKDKILQNPLDYIKLKHVQHQGVYNDSSLGITETLGSLSSMASISNSPLVMSTCEVTLYDTPHYNYYPHKLNQ